MQLINETEKVSTLFRLQISMALVSSNVKKRIAHMAGDPLFHTLDGATHSAHFDSQVSIEGQRPLAVPKGRFMTWRKSCVINFSSRVKSMVSRF